MRSALRAARDLAMHHGSLVFGFGFVVCLAAREPGSWRTGAVALISLASHGALNAFTSRLDRSVAEAEAFAAHAQREADRLLGPGARG